MFDPFPQREWAWYLPGAAYSVPRQMALGSKPLFHPEVLRRQVWAFNLPERVVAAGESRGNPAYPLADECTNRVEG
jgi:hypothetical protein